MATIEKAPAIIHASMLLGQERNLTGQQAWYVAACIDQVDRPQDPRFAGRPQNDPAGPPAQAISDAGAQLLSERP